MANTPNGDWDEKAAKSKILTELSRYNGALDIGKLNAAYEVVKDHRFISDDTSKWRLKQQGGLDLICRLMRFDFFQEHPFFTWMIDNVKSFGERKPFIGGDYLLDYAICYNVPEDTLNHITMRTLLENAARGVKEYEYEYGRSVRLSHSEEGGVKIIADRFATHHRNFQEYLKREPCSRAELLIAGVDLSFWDKELSFKEILEGVEGAPGVNAADKSKSEERASGLYVRHDYKDAPTFEEYKKNYILQEKLEDHIARFMSRTNYDQEMKKEGASTERKLRHIKFIGPPGTGKTTFARAVGRLYKDRGILDKGHVIETSGSTVIGEYVGQSAPNMREMGKAAKGGVLFVDEAYHIANNEHYGPEVVTELLKIMEDLKDEVVVIIAGYEDDIERLINTNSGMASRFGSEIEFDHFTRDELALILDMQVQNKGLFIRDDAANIMLDHMMWAKEQDKNLPVKQYGNARDMATLLDTVIDFHAVHLEEQAKAAELGTVFEGAIEKTILTSRAALDGVNDKKSKFKKSDFGFVIPAPGA
jgi:hypothetical protein